MGSCPTASRHGAGDATDRRRRRSRAMTEVHHGLEGVVAFETEIAEPDKEGSALRYRGVDIEELAGRVPVREGVGAAHRRRATSPACPPAEPYTIPIHTGDVRADVQAASRCSPRCSGMRQTYDISDEQARLDLSRVAVMVLSYAAQAARGLGQPIVAAARGRPGQHARRAVPDPLEGRGRPPARQGHRRLLELGGRARHERLDLHRPGDHLDRGGRRGRLLRSHRAR